MKLLTVAVPSYNVEQYLDKCLTSFSDDRLAEGLEVIVVNDGSRDRTQEIAESYALRYPQIFRVIKQENGGHGAAVNTGMRNATGKYFRIVDGDDWVDTDNMAKLLAALRQIDTDLVVDAKRTVNMVTGEERFYPLPDGVVPDRAYDLLDVCSDEICNYYMLHTVMAKTQLLREHQVSLQEHIFYVDYEYILKVTCASRSLTFLNLDVYRYLIGNAAQSVDWHNMVKRYSHHDKVVKTVLAFVKESDFTGKLREYADRRAALLIHTHYNISLIYNPDRKEGKRQAQEFRAFLQQEHPAFARMTEKRYKKALMLHLLGVDYDKLQKIMGSR